MHEEGDLPVARSVAGIALRSNRVFLARRVPGGSIGGKWEFPGGKIEPGESASDALVREFDEELGVEVSVGGAIGESAFSDGKRRFIVTAYLVSFSGQPVPHAEHSVLDWFPVDDLPAIDLPESDKGLVPALLDFVRRNGAG